MRQASHPCLRPLGRQLVCTLRSRYHGHPECVKLLIQVSDPTADFSRALYRAAENGQAECVSLLIPESEIEDVSDALAFAASNGHAECVKLLIPASDPKSKNSAGLTTAAIYGHAECIRLLIPVCDPTANGSHALREAAINGHADCVAIFNNLAPEAFEQIDLAALGAEAAKRGNPEMETFLASIADHRSLSGHIPASRAAPRSGRI